MSRRPAPGRVEATAGVLRDVFAIIMALAFTGAVVTFLTRDGFIPIKTADITLARVLVFLCVLPTIIRFYHGNVSYLNLTYAVSDAEAGMRHYAGKLAVDFLVFLTQAMIFSALAIYQSQVRDFFALFVCLLVVDAVWCLINVWFSGWTFRDFEGSLAQEHVRSQANWMFANFLTAILIGVPLAILWRGPGAVILRGVPYFFGVVTANALFDYWRNRRLYFPPGTARRVRSVPSSQHGLPAPWERTDSIQACGRLSRQCTRLRARGASWFAAPTKRKYTARHWPSPR